MKTKISVFNLHIVKGLKIKIVETGLKAKTIVFNIFLLSNFSLRFNTKNCIISQIDKIIAKQIAELVPIGSTACRSHRAVFFNLGSPKFLNISKVFFVIKFCCS